MDQWSRRRFMLSSLALLSSYGVHPVFAKNDDKKDGKPIYTTTIKSHFPTRSPVDSNVIPFSQFKKHYLSALSDEIGKLFYSVETGAVIPYGVMQ